MRIPTPQPRRNAPTGMSLVELLVALTLAVGLALLAFNLFGITQSAARSGIQRSTLVQQALSAETRLRNDFADMIGPNRALNAPAGAILVIPGLREGTLPVPGGGATKFWLRSDQLVFFYDAQNGGLAPGTGNGQAMTSLTKIGVKSSQAKVWIGHVRRDTVEPESALDWTLGRQATLLVDPDMSVVNTPANLNTSLILSPLGTGNDKLDIAAFGLEEIANWMRGLYAPAGNPPAAPPDTAMINAFAVPPAPATGVLLATQLPSVVTQPQNNTDGGLTAADILGGHRIFLSHVSEIVVQYTVDTASDGFMDTIGSSRQTGPLLWYPQDSAFTYLLSGPVAPAPKVFYPQDDQPRVVHLGYYQGPDDPTKYFTTNGNKSPYPNFGGTLTAPQYAAAMTAYAAHHNGWRPSSAAPPAQSKWPRMIRIRYRLHDSDGAVNSVNEEFATNGRDNAFGNRCSGIWFEHVFAVPYPRVN